MIGCPTYGFCAPIATYKHLTSVGETTKQSEEQFHYGVIHLMITQTELDGHIVNAIRGVPGRVVVERRSGFLMAGIQCYMISVTDIKAYRKARRGLRTMNLGDPRLVWSWAVGLIEDRPNPPGEIVNDTSDVN